MKAHKFLDLWRRTSAWVTLRRSRIDVYAVGVGVTNSGNKIHSVKIYIRYATEYMLVSINLWSFVNLKTYFSSSVIPQVRYFLLSTKSSMVHTILPCLTSMMFFCLHNKWPTCKILEKTIEFTIHLLPTLHRKD